MSKIKKPTVSGKRKASNRTVSRLQATKQPRIQSTTEIYQEQIGLEKPGVFAAFFREIGVYFGDKIKSIFGQKVRRIVRQPQFGPIVVVILAVLASFVFNAATVNHPIRHPSVLSTSATAAPSPAAVWCIPCRATSITIPSVLFSAQNINQVNFDQTQKTWPTPVSGIATPAETVSNNIVIFGHSIWFGKVSDFSRISGLKLGDKIYVSDQYGASYTFVVTKLELNDRMNGDAVHAKDNLQLTLLTSARYNGQWLLPTQVDPATVDNVQDPNSYAIFVVTAVPAN